MQPRGLSERVLTRLAEAEVCESNPHYCDDLKIARLTVAYAASGEAVYCTPHVLASYMVLGLHPEKVWPKVLARRKALGPLDVAGAPPVPKKPAQSVPLWCEKTNGARAVNSRAANTLLCDNTISVPMALQSIAALFPNPDEQSSAKKREYSYEDMLRIVRHSYARASIRRATLNALTARGPWPGADGPASSIICVAFDAMAQGDEWGDGLCSRRTAQRRAQLACDLKFWRRTHKYNRWLNCPKCGSERASAICPNEQCKYRGRSRNRDGSTNTKEFCRPYTFEIDIEKFLTAEPPKYVRHFCARTWKEHKAAAKRGEHPNVTEMPRKPAQPAPTDPPPTKAAPKPERERPAAEHRATPKPPAPKLSKTECVKFMANFEQRRRGRTSFFSRADGFNVALHPGEQGYAPPMPAKAAFAAECEAWRREPDAVRYALKFYEYTIEGLDL